MKMSAGFWVGMGAGVMTGAALTCLSLVGNVLIFCVGVNLLFGKKVKVANYLPALVLAVLWGVFAP